MHGASVTTTAAAAAAASASARAPFAAPARRVSRRSRARQQSENIDIRAKAGPDGLHVAKTHPFGAAAPAIRPLSPCCRGVRGRGAVAAGAGSSSSSSSSPSPSSLGVVITGATKGIGLALARDFLREGDRVVVCSRQQASVDEAVARLRREAGCGEAQVAGLRCDVSKAEDVKAFAAFARDQLGCVDVWINNAGSNAYQFTPLMETDASKLAEIVETNTLGLMFCLKECMEVMKAQPPGRTGHIFNMDGAGVTGSATPRFAAYGATKRAVTQLNKSLQAELGMMGIDNIVLHMLSPGMVTTELLMSGSDTKIAKFMINALAETPEEVASFLVPRVRQVVLDAEGPRGTEGAEEGAGGFENTLKATIRQQFGNGSSYIKYLTTPKAFLQIFLKGVFGIRNNKWVQE